MKRAIVIGLGGMGQRYIRALSLLNFKLVGVCDQNKAKLDRFKKSSLLKSTNYKDFLNLDAEIVCISSNTLSRENIIKDFYNKSKINKILTTKYFEMHKILS